MKNLIRKILKEEIVEEFDYKKILFKSGDIVYHGGDKEITNENVKNNIFTTPNLSGAMWYAEQRGGWLTKMIINYENPLGNGGIDEFVEIWIPILEKLNIKYEFNRDERGMDFISYDISKYGGNEYNPFDLTYIPNFIEEVKKLGFDVIVGWDELGQGSIPIYIPLYKENIEVINSEKII